jgi:hypothetical protein
MVSCCQAPPGDTDDTKDEARPVPVIRRYKPFYCMAFRMAKFFSGRPCPRDPCITHPQTIENHEAMLMLGFKTHLNLQAI